MIDIPPDIAAVAEALVDDLHTHPDVQFSGILAGPTFERRIAEVLAAERERCARVAQSFNGHAFPNEIAAAIREPIIANPAN